MIKIGENVVLVGDVHCEDNVSIWHNAVLRADTAPINIASGTNVQDLVMIHAGDGHAVNIGQNTTIGHSAIIHGCTIEDNVIVGMGSIIMNGAHILDHCLIGAGSLITEGKTFPAGSLIMGSPARVIRPLTEKEYKNCECSALHYQKMAEKELKTKVD